MDRLACYQSLIKNALKEYAGYVKSATPPVPYEVVLIFDDEHGHYLLRNLGWTGKERIRQTILHVAIREGKIWIEEDWTEDGIAAYFLEQGVPREDIVLGFQHPKMRPYTEFAVA